MKTKTLQQKNLEENLSPRGMARHHIANIRLLRTLTVEHALDANRVRLLNMSIDERVSSLRLALSDRKAAVSACLVSQ